MMLDDDSLDVLFRKARSHNGWSDKAVADELIYEMHDLARMGPTCANSNPARFLFLTSAAAKEKLSSMVAAGNVDKVTSAPVVCIIGHDQEFARHLPRLFAHNPGMRSLYANNAELAATTALRNGSLQGAYLMFAARSLGLDCGPMSGFNNSEVDEYFFGNSSVKSNFLCALGYGDNSKLFDRLPRFSFDEACEVL